MLLTCLFLCAIIRANAATVLCQIDSVSVTETVKWNGGCQTGMVAHPHSLLYISLNFGGRVALSSFSPL